MRPGWNPSRRNKNIGTARQGHGQDNRMVIPYRGRPFYTDVGEHNTVMLPLHGREMRFVVEKTRADCVHACSVDDIAHVLSFVPAEDLLDIGMVLLRQPKRKDDILSSVWGRLVTARVGRYEGTAIVLEAHDVSIPLRWGTKLDPDDTRELERLRQDGHVIEQTRREHVVSMTLDSVRNTQLYRTVPHEVGHEAQWQQVVEQPARKPGAVREDLVERYRQIPHCEREAFAHRYADTFCARLRSLGHIPFERKISPERLGRLGLAAEDFEVA